jgi:hypothetical protein
MPISHRIPVSAALIVATLCTALLSGCAAPPAKTQVVVSQPPPPARVEPPPPPPPVVKAPAEPSVSEKALATGLATYERGDYAGAIRQLTPLSTDSALNTGGQISALKTLAFSHCLSKAATACRQAFERAFTLDSKFDLAPAERGHPIWGPQFERARKAITGQ